jgi:putative endonuclease
LTRTFIASMRQRAVRARHAACEAVFMDARAALGRRSEAVARAWARLHGWRVLEVGGRHAGVQVDFLARRGRTVALVEVKGRMRAWPAPSLSWTQRLRLARAASAVAARPRFEDCLVRVDLLEVTWFGTIWPRVCRHEDVAREGDALPLLERKPIF